MENNSWFTESSQGKYQINSIVIYDILRNQINLKINEDESIPNIIKWISDSTKTNFYELFGKFPETGALNNSVGRWNEFLATSLLSELVVNTHLSDNECIVVLSLPNSTVRVGNIPEFLKLFKESSIAMLSHNISGIFFPSPDYVVAAIKNKDLIERAEYLLHAQIKNPESLDLFNYLEGKLEFSEVKSVISLKTSHRPDRRYQPSFEAAMIKAIGCFLENPWKYYMVTSELRPADKLLFQNISSPHGIANGVYEKLVDGILLYHKKTDLLPLINSTIL
jgi:hypothetical protein